MQKLFAKFAKCTPEYTVRLLVRKVRGQEEYCVNYILNGRRVEEKCYYSSDVDDACLTMLEMAKEFV